MAQSKKSKGTKRAATSEPGRHKHAKETSKGAAAKRLRRAAEEQGIARGSSWARGLLVSSRGSGRRATFRDDDDDDDDGDDDDIGDDVNDAVVADDSDDDFVVGPARARARLTRQSQRQSTRRSRGRSRHGDDGDDDDGMDLSELIAAVSRGVGASRRGSQPQLQSFAVRKRAAPAASAAHRALQAKVKRGAGAAREVLVFSESEPECLDDSDDSATNGDSSSDDSSGDSVLNAVGAPARSLGRARRRRIVVHSSDEEEPVRDRRSTPQRRSAAVPVSARRARPGRRRP